MYCSLRFWNVSCDRVVDIYASKDLVEKADATFLELCGWDFTENAGGTFQFQTHSLKIVQASFASSDMMPDLVDPLFTITFIKYPCFLFLYPSFWRSNSFCDLHLKSIFECAKWNTLLGFSDPTLS